MTNGRTCLMCGEASGSCKFCRSCREKKNEYSARVSQNIFKLQNLLKIRDRSSQWFEKFIIYADNIKRYGTMLMEFKASDSLRSFIVLENFN